MFYPKLKSIATKEVIAIKDSQTIKDAVHLMDENNIRDIIIQSDAGLKILLAAKILEIKIKNIPYESTLDTLTLPFVKTMDSEASVEQALKESMDKDDYICLLDADKNLYGIVSYSDISQSLDPSVLAKTQTLSEIVYRSKFLTVCQDIAFETMLLQMVNESFSVAIVHKKDKTVGIVTQRDLIKVLDAQGQTDIKVKDIMATPVETISVDTTIHDALEFLQKRKFKRLVIEDSGNVVGILTQKELVSIYYNQWFDSLKEHKKQLEAKNEELELIADHLPDGMLVLNQKGFITKVNREAAQMLGYSKEELVGLSMTQLFGCSLDLQAEQTYVHCLKENKMVQAKDCSVFGFIHGKVEQTCEETFMKKDRSLIYVSMTTRRLSESSDSTHMIILFRDMSQDKIKLERDMFVGGPSVLFVWQLQKGWPVEYVSPNVAKILGYAKPHFESQKIIYADLIHPHDLAQVADEVSAAIKVQDSTVEHQYRLKDSSGSYRWFYDYTVLSYDSSGEATVAKGYLIERTKEVRTQQKLEQTTQKLHKLNRYLEDEVQKQLKELVDKDKMLQQQAKLAAMGEMINAIAHQWRQPLNALSINIQNLDDDYADGLIDADFVEEFIQKQQKTISFMSHTIDDFRNFFKTNKEKTRFSILHMIQSVTELLAAQLSNNSIECIIEGEDFMIEGYQSEIKQVILNLINNSKDAIVGKQKAGTIKIILDKQKKMLFFKDSGGGVSEQILPKLFDPYFTTKEHDKGTGIGLYMSQVIIVDHMQGRIKAYNEGSGLCVQIEF
ncbi:MAG: CBS domain-containing protein [Campylobacterota bacterium]